VFITNLPADYTQDKMRDIFNNTNLKVVKANLLTDDAGKSKCAGFVEFSNHSEAQEAVKHANNMAVANKRLNVQFAKR
jgi:RNA recognition motif-containing protein